MVVAVGVALAPIQIKTLSIVVVSATNSPIVDGLIVKQVILHGFVVIAGLVTLSITNLSCLKTLIHQSKMIPDSVHYYNGIWIAKDGSEVSKEQIRIVKRYHDESI